MSGAILRQVQGMVRHFLRHLVPEKLDAVPDGALLFHDMVAGLLEEGLCHATRLNTEGADPTCRRLLLQFRENGRGILKNQTTTLL